MPNERYFIIRTRPREGETVFLDAAESRHLLAAVRARPGEAVVLLDGEGGRYEALIRSTEPCAAAVEIVSCAVTPRPAQVDLVIAVTRAPRMDLAVEKCAELGVRRIIPLACRRGLWRGGFGDARHKAQRLVRKVEAACKQSGNPWFTVVDPVSDICGLTALLGGWEKVFLADAAGKPAPKAVRRTRQTSAVLGIVGPEGGFTSAERGELVGAGAVPVSLGPNRLRSETAAVCLAWWLIRAVESPH